MSESSVLAEVNRLVAEHRRKQDGEIDALRTRLRHLFLLLRWAEALYPGFSGFN